MANKIYALLVGINDYQAPVRKLAGCLNDVDHFHAYLTSHFDKSNLNIEILKDGDATRGNIVKLFRTHLCKAQADDVAVFQYCGHGARWASAKAFHEFYPDGKDEGLVCYDSRHKDYDLADKELAVLLSEVAKNNPHLAVILDCCHSGSGTRDVDAFNHLVPRVAYEVKDERPLDSYLDGHYAKLHKEGKQLFIPTSKHILLAACERTQTAKEAPDRSGVFTSTLVEVLDKSGSDITYANLFVRCRAAVLKRAEDQNPQFESYEGFNAWTGFLGREATHGARRYSVYFDDKMKHWRIDAGAIHGLPTEPEKSVGLLLYREDDQSRETGKASTTRVGAQKSELELHFAGDKKVRYQAEITNLPVPPIPVYLQGDKKATAMLQKALTEDQSVNVIFTETEKGTQYALSAEDGKFLLKQREMDLLIQGVEGHSEASAKRMLAILKHVVQWEKGLALQNHNTKLDPQKVDFAFYEILEDGKEHKYEGKNEITLDFVKVGDKWKPIRCKLKARNAITKPQPLWFTLVYFSRQYGIKVLKNDPIDPNQEVTLWGENPKDALGLAKEVNESIDNFKLIVSTEQVDNFLLEQEPLKLGEIIPSTRDIIEEEEEREKIQNDWFTKTIRIKTVRQMDQLSAGKDTSLAQGKIVIKGHPSVKANLSLSAAKTPTRSTGQDFNFYKAFEQQGMEMVNFAAGTRGEGANENILELTDIQNAEALEKNPLEIEVNAPLKENEYLLPLVFDGKHVLLGGDPAKDDQGNTHIRIDHIPEVPDNRRSLGKALKLYFFKTYLKQENVNLLCWVKFKEDGTVVRNKSEVANKVAAAQNILLLLHGIIGDTEVIAKGLRLAGLDKKFDLVLTYDYENLSTPISETAAKLKQQLEATGLGENDNKQLTVLAHSMGGLVSRWFIEREGGNKFVDHLVMCGTPNNGSPFGKIDKARKLLSVLTGLAVNYVPPLIPFSGAVIFLLNRLKKITPTLEQMDPSSEFIKTLNGSGDPGVRYTILAGDIDKYEEPSDRFFPEFLEKLGKGIVFDALFGNASHDIAVSVESILGVNGVRNPAPKKANVACHHLNYFISEPGVKSLSAVEW